MINCIISYGTLVLSLMSLLSVVVYFLYFNFNNDMMKVIYLIVLIAYPVICLVVNLIVANNLNSNILQDQHENPENAEWLDFEDNEEDILRKAKVRAVQRKVQL